MENNLTNLVGITLNRDGFITSVDLVDIINHFREEEFNILKDKGLNKKDNVTLLIHGDFIKKINKELEVLESLGLVGQGNISKSSYINSQNKEQPCFKLNRNGMLQMLNSESTIVRAKTIEYINKLEEELKNAKEDKEQLYNVAISDKKLEQRQYEADKVKYALRNIKSLLSDCNYTNLENEVNNIINVHTNLKKKDRYEYHRDMNNTEYKQYVRKFVKDKLEEIMVTKKDMLLVMVAKTIQLRLESESHTTTKKSSSHIISAKEKENKVYLRQIDDYKDKYDNDSNDINNYEVVDIHGMSCNYLFKYDSMFGAIKTSTYRKWINDFTRLFEENQLATKEDWEFYYDIDFTKPICIYIKYVAKAEFDIENFNKATIDMLFNRLFGVDDNIVHKVVSERLAVCDTYADGKIMYYIENI